MGPPPRGSSWMETMLKALSRTLQPSGPCASVIRAYVACSCVLWTDSTSSSTCEVGSGVLPRFAAGHFALCVGSVCVGGCYRETHIRQTIVVFRLCNRMHYRKLTTSATARPLVPAVQCTAARGFPLLTCTPLQFSLPP